jgi:hypothetical protein
MDEWHAYEAAVILRMDGRDGTITKAVEYFSPAGARPEDEASITFKAARASGNKLYVVTNTEILVYEVPTLRQLQYLSLPWFNDLHYACPNRAGNLLVACTGLDMVAEISSEGEVLKEWPVLGGDTWGKFSKDIDYRKVASTKPHASHPNFIIETEDDLWVTRNMQKDAVSLLRPDRRVQFLGYPHDGIKRDGKIYFSTVNGYIHIVDEKTMKMVETIDLNGIEHEDVALGWMRGVLPVGDNLCWVGFTRLRRTKFKDNVSWVKHGFRQYYLPTRIALYDLAKRQLLQEVDIEPFGIHAIYSILEELPSVMESSSTNCWGSDGYVRRGIAEAKPLNQAENSSPLMTGVSNKRGSRYGLELREANPISQVTAECTPNSASHPGSSGIQNPVG